MFFLRRFFFYPCSELLWNNILIVMTSILTMDSITRIWNGDIMCNPILQILDFTPASEDRYSVHLSDGISTIHSLFASPLSLFFTSSKLEVGSLVQIDSFTCKSIQSNEYVFNLYTFSFVFFSCTSHSKSHTSYTVH